MLRLFEEWCSGDSAVAVSEPNAPAMNPVRTEGSSVNQTTKIATERWTLDPWTGGPDPDDLGQTWASKPAVAVDGRRSCPELAVLARLKLDGWDGVWVNAYRNELRQEWFPAPAVSIADVAPEAVVALFERLRAANGGRLGGFLDVFAWRDSRVRFLEVKSGRDKWRESQQRFVDMAVGLGRDPSDLLLVEVT
jgi:hypothetical protein